VENNYVNYTTQSVINTNNVRTYRLDHRAVSPKYNKKEIRSYYFHVVDLTAPEVISSSSFKIAYGQDEPDYLIGLVVSDNYTQKDQIEIIVDSSNVDYSRIGVYEILYTISDCSGNKTFHTETLEIVDLIKPTITKLKDLTIQVGDAFLVEEYFLIEDNYDPNPTIIYEIIGGTNELGDKEINIRVIDQSGNETIYNDMVTIVDNIPPTITLSKDVVEVNVNEEIDLYSFVEVSDNYDEVTLDNLVITNNINYALVGSYEVIYTLTDSSGNESVEILTVVVRDLIKPTIHANDMEINKGEDVNFLMYARVTDNLSEPGEISLKIIYNDVNINKPGIYSVTFEAVDQFGNHAYKTINVTVLGSTEEQKIFYFLLAIGGATLVGLTTIIVIKKRKKAY
jgi:hypothetical protein